jgi:hypothetical protein
MRGQHEVGAIAAGDSRTAARKKAALLATATLEISGQER